MHEITARRTTPWGTRLVLIDGSWRHDDRDCRTCYTCTCKTYPDGTAPHDRGCVWHV